MTCRKGDRHNNDATESEPDYQQFGHPVEPLSHWRHESTVVTALISSAGARKVAAVTAVPSRMREVLAAKSLASCMPTGGAAHTWPHSSRPPAACCSQISCGRLLFARIVAPTVSCHAAAAIPFWT